MLVASRKIANALIELRTSSTLPRCSRGTDYPSAISASCLLTTWTLRKEPKR
jgi:hypothetical protein